MRSGLTIHFAKKYWSERANWIDQPFCGYMSQEHTERNKRNKRPNAQTTKLINKSYTITATQAYQYLFTLFYSFSIIQQDTSSII